MVFSKTQLANRALTEQFTQRLVKKAYVLLTDRPVPPEQLVVKSALVRAGSKYVSYPVHAAGELAETLFRAVAVKEVSGHGAGRTIASDVAACRIARHHEGDERGAALSARAVKRWSMRVVMGGSLA